MNQYRSVVAALTLAAFSLAGAQTPPMPKGPVTINVIDVAGTRQFHRGAVIVPELLPECPIPVDALLP